MLEFARPPLRRSPREGPVHPLHGDIAFEPFGLFCRQVLGVPCGGAMIVPTYLAIIFSVCPVGIRETLTPIASARDLSGVTP
jgi:hypothetical protein